MFTGKKSKKKIEKF